MKKLHLLGIASSLLLAFSCQKAELGSACEEGVITVGVQFEQPGTGGTKATETSRKFAWERGDRIAIARASGGFENFTAKKSGAVSQFTGRIVPFYKFAVYPAAIAKSLTGDSLTVNLPVDYYVEEITENRTTHSPMLATFEEETPSVLSFRHMGSLLCFTVNNLPEASAKFVFSTNKGITGDFPVEMDGGVNVIKAKDQASADNTVTIEFEPTAGLLSGVVFYVPLPTGQYGGYTVEFFDTEDRLAGYYSTESPFTLNRKVLGRKTIDLCSITGTIEDGDHVVITEEEEISIH